MPKKLKPVPDDAQRRGGVFLTPLPFAQKSLEVIDQTLGNGWLQTGNYRLWDMAAGTGNLEHFLPKETHQYCYLSTLEQNDVEYLQQTFPHANVFQYDYLRDDTKKMPTALQNDWTNPAIKWMILVNPPYATAQEAGLRGTSKEGVADTNIRKRMHAENLGEVSRELYVQFLYRIVHEFKHRQTMLGLFAPLKYLISSNYQKFRDHVFHADYTSGFIFSSENFDSTSRSSHFPVSFILWNLRQNTEHVQSPHPSPPPKGKGIDSHLQTIQLDILDHTAQKIGTKTVKSIHRCEFLSRWIKRPRGTTVFPPFGSALVIKTGNIDTRNRIAEGFLVSLMCPGNELQNQQQTAFLSGPQASAGALSVTPDNFEQAVVVFAARRIPQDSWINHVDQFLRPNRELSPQFVSDCAVWSLFDSKNQTVALQSVHYQDRVYQIANHFFPFTIFEVQHWKISDPVIRHTLADASNSFVADWLAPRKLSVEALEVLSCAKEIYRYFFSHLHLLRKIEFGIETYDAGWYQIRKVLDHAELFDDLTRRRDLLKERILSQLGSYGIFICSNGFE